MPDDLRPYIENHPTVLIRQETPPRRTPVINGDIAKPLADLIQHPDTTTEQIESSLRLNDADPAAEPIWGQARDDIYRASLAYFFEDVIRGPEEAPYNGKSLVGKHHEDWDLVVSEHERILIEASRDHGKSHFFSLAYPIWMGGWVKPKSLGYIFSSTQDTAEALLTLVKTELLENPKLAHLIPTTGERFWSKREIKLRNGTTIRARGMGVRVRGGHPDWIVCDDLLTDDDIYSETLRKRNIDYYLSAIVNMIKPGGQIIVVGTPLHFADLYGHIEQTGQYFVKKYPAIDEKGRILFPERYDRKRLEDRKKEVGPTRFAREFLCQPLTDESSLFPTKLFAGGDIRIPYTLGLPASYWDKLGWPRYTGVDFAMSASAGADYTVIFTIALDGQGNRWIVNIRREKGWGFQEQLDAIKDEFVKYGPDVIHAEANQMQRIFTDEIIRETDIPIRKFFTSGVQPRQPWRKGMTALTMGKHHIDRGVPSLRMTLENRKWRIPRGDEKSIELTDLWIGEMSAMGWVNGQVSSAGEHDDTVMACWFVDAAARIGGFNFSFGDESKGSETENIKLPGELMGETIAEVQINQYITPKDNSKQPNVPQSADESYNESDFENYQIEEGAPKATEFGLINPGFPGGEF